MNKNNFTIKKALSTINKFGGQNYGIHKKIASEYVKPNGKVGCHQVYFSKVVSEPQMNLRLSEHIAVCLVEEFNKFKADKAKKEVCEKYLYFLHQNYSIPEVEPIPETVPA